jgi:hypothetical protein
MLHLFVDKNSRHLLPQQQSVPSFTLRSFPFAFRFVDPMFKFVDDALSKGKLPPLPLILPFPPRPLYARLHIMFLIETSFVMLICHASS